MGIMKGCGGGMGGDEMEDRWNRRREKEGDGGLASLPRLSKRGREDR